MSPTVKCWRPEVHHQYLLFIQEVNVLRVFHFADLVAIEEPRDVVWCPLDLVFVPLCTWGEPADVTLVLGLVLPDNVRAVRVFTHRRHDFNIDLVPPLDRPIWSIPVREEGCDSARLVITLDSCSEFPVFEFLLSLDLTALPVGFGLGEYGCSDCE